MQILTCEHVNSVNHSEPSDSAWTFPYMDIVYIHIYNIVNFSAKDMIYSPSIIPTIHFEHPKEENLSTKNKSAKFISFPKCPSVEGSILYIRLLW